MSSRYPSWTSKPRWSRGSVPSSHARGQRFKPRSRQYLFIRRSLSWFGLASTPVESLPNLTPPSCWVRHVRSIGGPQYGLAVCHHSQRSGRRPQQQNPTWEWRQHSWAEFPMMVIHHTHLPLHFFHRWRPSGGSWCCTTTHSDAIYNIHPT